MGFLLEKIMFFFKLWSLLFAIFFTKYSENSGVDLDANTGSTLQFLFTVQGCKWLYNFLRGKPD